LALSVPLSRFTLRVGGDSAFCVAFDIMRTYTKFILLSPVAIVLAGGLLFVGGCLSTSRDFSSPPTSIRVVDLSGAPMSSLEVGRHWYDSDSGSNGSDEAVTDQSGTFHFSKVPADIGLFTGAWRKTYSHLGMCGVGSGTYTEIYVRFHGRYDVLPRGKPLHTVGKYGARQDSDGVWFTSDLDNGSNTLVSLTFPSKAKSIDYVLSAKRQAE